MEIAQCLRDFASQKFLATGSIDYSVDDRSLVEQTVRSEIVEKRDRESILSQWGLLSTTQWRRQADREFDLIWSRQEKSQSTPIELQVWRENPFTMLGLHRRQFEERNKSLAARRWAIQLSDRTAKERLPWGKGLQFLFAAAKKDPAHQYWEFIKHLGRLTRELGDEELSALADLPEFDVKNAIKRIDEHVSYALNAQDLKKANVILNLASALFPKVEHYKRLKNIIGPPSVVDVKNAKTKGLAKTVSFLKKSGKNFDRKWIAVSHGELLGVSDSFSELVEKHVGDDVIITRVLE